MLLTDKILAMLTQPKKGGGFGGSFGYRKYFPFGKGDFALGFHTDIWSLDIDWTDTAANDVIVSGNTTVLVVQPWLEGGYFLPIKNTASRLGLTIGFGREINVVTRGEEVEQGFIGSVLLHYQVSL